MEASGPAQPSLTVSAVLDTHTSRSPSWSESRTRDHRVTRERLAEEAACAAWVVIGIIGGGCKRELNSPRFRYCGGCWHTIRNSTHHANHDQWNRWIVKLQLPGLLVLLHLQEETSR